MMEQSLDFILKKFPDYRNRITDLFCKNENFRNLSEDLIVTIRMLEECRLAAQINGELESEYLHAYFELERELIDFVNKSDK